LMFLDQHREILVADLAGLFLTADIRDVDWKQGSLLFQILHINLYYNQE
jgi:hypothetical protein